MKRIICFVLSLTLILPCFSAFAQNNDILLRSFADQTWYMQNGGQTKRINASNLLLTGTVYDRTSFLEFDLSKASECDFGGCILRLTVRNEDENNRVSIYSFDKISGKVSGHIITVSLSQTGKILCEYVITDYIKSCLEKGETKACIAVKSTADVMTVFSKGQSKEADRPCIEFTKDKAYVKGQLDFAWPVPTTEEYLSEISVATAGGHPYLFGRKADFERIKELAFGKDEFLTEQYGAIKTLASKELNKAPVEISVTGTPSYITRGFNAAWNLVPMCAFVWLVEGDKDYAERAWKEAEYFANLSSWGTYQSLDNNQAALIVAIAYDWLYDYLSEEQRTLLYDALRKNHLDTVLDLYRNPTASKYNTSFHQFVFSTNNHGTVNNCSTFISALAICERDPEFSAEIMSNATQIVNKVLDNLYPDSAWSEGVGYWGFVGPLMARMMLAMNSAFGHSFGYENIPTLLKCAEFPMYATSSYGQFLFNDTEGYTLKDVTCDKFIFGALGDDYVLQKWAMENDDMAHPFACLTYNPDFDYDSVEVKALSKDKLFRNCDLVTMRDSRESTQQTFGGMVVQKADLSHGHMNSGTIAFDALGERWVTNPGRDSYSLPGYSWYDEAWQYYCKRAEGNSCIVINPSSLGGQNKLSEDTISEYVSKPGGAYAISDLTDTYKGQVNSYKRGVMLTDNRKRFIMQDEIHLVEPSEVYSFINVYKSDIEVLENGKEVILSKGSKKVKVSIISDQPFNIEIMDSNPLKTSPKMPGQSDFKDLQRIAIHYGSVKDVNIRVAFTPYLTQKDPLLQSEDVFVLFDEWDVSEEDVQSAYISDLKVDGVSVQNFNPYDNYYEIESETKEYKLEAVSDLYDTEIVYNPDNTSYEIYVCDKSDGKILNTYLFTVKAPPVTLPKMDLSNYEELKIKEVSATDDDGNVPSGAIDKDIETRWSASGEQAITFKLGTASKIDYIAIAFFNGTTRRTIFDVQVSNDGKTWKTVHSNVYASGVSDDYEYFDLSGVKAQYVKICGHGNDKNAWNSITEVAFYKKK